MMNWMSSLLTKRISQDKNSIICCTNLIFDLKELLEKAQKQLLNSHRHAKKDEEILEKIKEIIKKLYTEKSNLLIKHKILNISVDKSFEDLEKKMIATDILIEIIQNFADNNDGLGQGYLI